MPGISRYDLELDRWNGDVDEEASSLVARGINAYDAQELAREEVRRRRARERETRRLMGTTAWQRKTSS